METDQKTKITVETAVGAPVEKVWTLWTDPKHITAWNNASDDWHTPEAENDLRVGGKFRSRMAARDGSAAFDFEGVYDEVEKHKLISYALADGRKVKIKFAENGQETVVTESFDAENSHPAEMQQTGWQAILNNFKKYAEAYNEPVKLHFEITIEARPAKVYTIMLDEKSYTEWTFPFNPGSHFIGSWEKGSKIIFLGTDSEGKSGGMVSRIKENIPYQFVSVEHLGIVQDGKEITSGKEVEGWAGALENYTFKEEDGCTLLSVDMDSNPEFAGYFSETWPKALNRLKEICEGPQ